MLPINVSNPCFVQGFVLVFESVLPSVIIARDKWLKPVSFRDGRGMNLSMRCVSVNKF